MGTLNMTIEQLSLYAIHKTCFIGLEWNFDKSQLTGINGQNVAQIQMLKKIILFCFIQISQSTFHFPFKCNKPRFNDAVRNFQMLTHEGQ